MADVDPGVANGNISMVSDDSDPSVPEARQGERDLIFDDTYRGPRWRYGLSRRHLVHYLGTSVADWILYSERHGEDPRFPFGTVDYPRPLPEEEARRHELEPLGMVGSKTAGVPLPEVHPALLTCRAAGRVRLRERSSHLPEVVGSRGLQTIRLHGPSSTYPGDRCSPASARY
jgi:hypothetical protein